ncbi:MAG: sulfatase-like hydrolase/transferase [Succinivibrionaceae bacterium]
MCCKQKDFKKSPQKMKNFRGIFIIALVIFISIRCYPTKLFLDFVTLSKYALNDLDDFNRAVNKPTDIEILKNDKKIKNVVVIIGESVETDYLSVMGYIHPTTPNLDKLNGHFYKNNISVSSYTIVSLMPTLTYSPDKLTYQLNNNIVNLANKAGFSTYFFSLEGDGEKELLNDYFSSISKYNKYKLPKAKSVDLTNKSQDGNIKWQLLQNRNDDFKLLSLFNFSISDQEEYRMIFLHMKGHHPNVCHRLHSYSNIFKDIKHVIPNNSPDELNCYLSVTHKLDYFIAHINNKLIELGEPYYLFYISDHGLLFDLESKLRTFIHHGHSHKSNFRAPLIVLSSEIKTHEVISDYIYSYDFISNFINYLNIDTNIIKAKGINELRKATPKDIDIYVNGKLMKYSEMKDFKIYY